MISYYYTGDVGEENCQEFETIVEFYSNIRFFQPSPDKAPWHVQAILDSDPEPIILNFWPHKMKGQLFPQYAVEGVGNVSAIIEEAMEDAGAPDFEVLEE